MSKRPKKAKRDKPAESRDGRDPKTGHFLPGNDGFGGGRPRRPDIYTLAEELAGRKNFNLRERLQAVIDKLILLAEAGDVQAIKLVADRFTIQDPVEVNLNDATSLTDIEREAKIKRLFALAKAREAKANGEVRK